MKRIKIFYFISITLLSATATISCSNNSDDFTVLRNAYKDYLIETVKTDAYIEKGPEVILSELSSETINGVETLYYPNINYKEAGTTDKWEPTKHTSDMLAIAVSAAKTKDSRYQNIAIGMAYYWIYNDFKSANWWFNDLGAGTSLSSTALFIYDDLNEQGKIALRSRISRTSFYYNESLLTHTGSNLFDYADNTLKSSVIHRNRVEFELAIQRIEQEITDNGSEGFQPDGSFFQHGAQIQTMSNYGRSVIRLANLINLIDKTSRHFSLEKLKILTHFILKGISRGTFKGYSNYLEVAREYTRHDTYCKSDVYFGLEKYLELPNLPGRHEFEDFISKLKVRRPTFNGITYFDNSKLVTMNLDSLYISFKGSHPDLITTESVNGENKLGLNLSYGTSTCVMDKGDEYYEISPLWDYAYLPGTTSYQIADYDTSNSLKEYLEKTDAGIKEIGYSNPKYYSDGVYDHPLPSPTEKNGYVYNKKDGYDKENDIVCLMQRSCHHKENNFTVTCIACEDGMFLMGADLKYTGEVTDDFFLNKPPIHTTIEQCKYKGNITLSSDKKELTHGNAFYKVYDDHEIKVRGYNESSGKVDYKVDGDWTRNRGTDGTLPPDPTSGDILLAYLDTSDNNKYAYSIQPVSYQDRKFELIDNFPTDGPNQGKKVQAVKLPAEEKENPKIVIVAYQDVDYVLPDSNETIHLNKGEFKVI